MDSKERHTILALSLYINDLLLENRFNTITINEFLEFLNTIAGLLNQEVIEFKDEKAIQEVLELKHSLAESLPAEIEHYLLSSE